MSQRKEKAAFFAELFSKGKKVRGKKIKTETKRICDGIRDVFIDNFYKK